MYGRICVPGITFGAINSIEEEDLRMRILRLISKGRNGFVNSVAKGKAKGYWQVGPAEMKLNSIGNSISNGLFEGCSFCI